MERVAADGLISISEENNKFSIKFIPIILLVVEKFKKLP
jgi:hypothetical protein